jgi:hypothetical protein
MADRDDAVSVSSSGYRSVVSTATSASAMKSRRRPKQQTPQQAIDEFWAKFSSKTPGKGQWPHFASRRNIMFGMC